MHYCLNFVSKFKNKSFLFLLNKMLFMRSSIKSMLFTQWWTKNLTKNPKNKFDGLGALFISWLSLLKENNFPTALHRPKIN